MLELKYWASPDDAEDDAGKGEILGAKRNVLREKPHFIGISFELQTLKRRNLDDTILISH